MRNNLGTVVGALPVLAMFETGKQIPKSPLDLSIVEVDMETAMDLNAEWHSMLPRNNRLLLGNMLCGNTSVAYAAEYRSYYFAVAIFSQPIIRQLCDGHTIELRRMAICSDAPKNTASRMLSVMKRLVVRKFDFIKKIISYQAIDVHRGTMYRAAGWKVAGKVCDARPQRQHGSKQRATGPLQTTSRKQRWEVLI